MSEAVVFCVHGNPLPKQSYRASRGGGYTDPRIKDWQDIVSWKAREAMIDHQIFEGPVEVWITFWRKDSIRVDCDNLSKAVCDALNNIVFMDDRQIVDLHIRKRVNQYTPGCRIRVAPASEKEEAWMVEES